MQFAIYILTIMIRIYNRGKTFYNFAPLFVYIIILVIESIKTTSMENVSTGVLEK